MAAALEKRLLKSLEEHVSLDSKDINFDYLLLDLMNTFNLADPTGKIRRFCKVCPDYEYI